MTNMDPLFQLLDEATIVASRSYLQSTGEPTTRLVSGDKGRPKYAIQRSHLEVLVGLGFSVPLINSLLHVRIRTVERRLVDFGINLLLGIDL